MVGCTRKFYLHCRHTNPGLAIDSANVVSAACGGMGLGSITVYPSGGDTAYSYKWSNGPTTNPITNLPNGSYTVTVTDAAGCTATAYYIIGSSPCTPCPAALPPIIMWLLLRGQIPVHYAYRLCRKCRPNYFLVQ